MQHVGRTLCTTQRSSATHASRFHSFIRLEQLASVNRRENSGLYYAADGGQRPRNITHSTPKDAARDYTKSMKKHGTWSIGVLSPKLPSTVLAVPITLRKFACEASVSAWPGVLWCIVCGGRSQSWILAQRDLSCSKSRAQPSASVWPRAVRQPIVLQQLVNRPSSVAAVHRQCDLGCIACCRSRSRRACSCSSRGSSSVRCPTETLLTIAIAPLWARVEPINFSSAHARDMGVVHIVEQLQAGEIERAVADGARGRAGASRWDACSVHYAATSQAADRRLRRRWRRCDS